MMEAKIAGILDKGWKKKLLSLPNVVGYSAIPHKRLRDGKETEEFVFRVYVNRKVPKSVLRVESLVPEMIEGVPTDVYEVGEIRAYQNSQRMRPCPPGYSIGHYLITAGTFGCVVKDKQGGKSCILSNNHVLANENLGKIGDPILQPGPYDGGVNPADVIATLTRFVKVELGTTGCTLSKFACWILNGIAALVGAKTRFQAKVSQVANVVDCAIATPINDVDIITQIKGIGTPKGIEEAAVGMKVHKCGRTTDLTNLIVQDTAYAGYVGYSNGTAYFEDQVMMVGDGMTGSAGGDSGSIMLDRANENIVALLFAGSDSQNVTIGNKIQNVIAKLDVMPVT
jgi:hypothetical protein